MAQQLEEQQQTLSTIQNQHNALLLQIEGPEEVDLKQVRAFLNTIAQAGTIINAPEDRSLLHELIRYWSSFISDKTGEFPVIRLQPFSLSLEESGLLAADQAAKTTAEQVKQAAEQVVQHAADQAAKTTAEQVKQATEQVVQHAADQTAKTTAEQVKQAAGNAAQQGIKADGAAEPPSAEPY